MTPKECIENHIKSSFPGNRVIFIPTIQPKTEATASDQEDSLVIPIYTYWNGKFKAETDKTAYPFDSEMEAFQALVDNFNVNNIDISEDNTWKYNKVVVVLWRIFPQIVEFEGKYATRMRIGIGKI